jgi:hypothetical protein
MPQITLDEASDLEALRLQGTDPCLQASNATLASPASTIDDRAITYFHHKLIDRAFF